MAFRLLADAIVVLHLAFVLFVVAGGLLVVRWPRVAWAHLPAAAWGAWVEFAGMDLSPHPDGELASPAGGQAVYTTSFVDRYLLPVLYPPALSREIQWVLGALVLAVNAGVVPIQLPCAGACGQASKPQLGARTS